ncbi:MAG: GNAT family N-acetyltransferase [Defluviitaleaceae bacterium]|nr:GNAT family N-acetyltransferase [Defluviitaleaceae bacterium]
MKLEIREIEEKDYTGVLSLWNNELGNSRVTAENIASHYDRIKNDERYKIFVAVLGDDVVGLISSVWSYAVGFEVGYMHINGIAVKSGTQGMGVGAKLLERMEEHAKSIGISTALIGCNVGRTKSHAFYENKGYSKDSWLFDKKL